MRVIVRKVIIEVPQELVCSLEKSDLVFSLQRSEKTCRSYYQSAEATPMPPGLVRGERGSESRKETPDASFSNQGIRHGG